MFSIIRPLFISPSFQSFAIFSVLAAFAASKQVNCVLASKPLQELVSCSEILYSQSVAGLIPPLHLGLYTCHFLTKAFLERFI